MDGVSPGLTLTVPLSSLPDLLRRRAPVEHPHMVLVHLRSRFRALSVAFEAHLAKTEEDHWLLELAVRKVPVPK